jgi:hypothetical protein
MKTDLPGCDNAVPICDTRIADVSCVMRRSGQSFIINPSDVTVVVSCCVYSASVVVRAFAYRGQCWGLPKRRSGWTWHWGPTANFADFDASSK